MMVCGKDRERFLGSGLVRGCTLRSHLSKNSPRINADRADLADSTVVVGRAVLAL